MLNISNKAEIREYLKMLRAQMPVEQVNAVSQQVTRHVLACDAYRRAKCIMGYLAFGNEISVDQILKQALADGKIVSIPHIVSDTKIIAVPLKNMDSFHIGRFGIRSVSNPSEYLAPQEQELILVPGLAFGRDGSRMGMGAGYYDRFLPQASNALLMGVAYDAMLQTALPCEKHDIFMQLLVSESGIININKTKY